MESLSFLEFGPFRIDFEQRLLFQGDVVIPTAPKAFETLLVLVENHGRVVSKDDLLKRVWPDTFVEEGSLARNVSILRKLLGENADDQAFIETIPKRGYRFVAPVRSGLRVPLDATISGESLPPSSARRFRRGRGVGLVLATIAALATGLAVWRLLSGRPTERTASILDLDLKRIPNSESAIAVAISADGKFMTYVDQPRADEGPSVKVRQLSNNEDTEVVAPSTIIGPDGSMVPAMIWGLSLAPDDGFIYFVRNSRPLISSVWRVPFLASTPPRKIVDDVRTPVGWRADGKQIAFIRTAPGQSDSLMVAEADGSHEEVRATRTPPAAFETINTDVLGPPAWSPDGKTIAVLGHDTKNGKRVWEIVLVNVADGSERTTIRPPGRPIGLGWLDNDELLFTSKETGIGPSQLWRVSSSDGQRSKLTNDVSDYLEFSLTGNRDTLVALRSEWSMGIWLGNADGTSMSELRPPSADIDGVGSNALAWAGDRLLYTSKEKGSFSIMSVVPGSGVAPEVLIANAYSPSATSDGKTIVFQSIEDSPRTNLWTSDGDGRNRKQIVSGSVSFPMVTPDDRFVVFRSTRSGDMDSPWYVPIGGGTPQEIIHMPTGNRASVSPDGKKLLFSTQSAAMQSPQAFICDFPACSSLQKVPRWGKWMPDGKRIATGNNPKDLANLWAQSIEGGPDEPFTQFKEVMGIMDFQWTRDGKRLAVARGGGRGDVVLFKGMSRLKH